MAPDRIREVIRATPFRPFTAELGGGKRVSVTHTDYASLSPAGRTLIVYDDRDGMEIIDAFLITNVSVEGADSAGI